ncbi:hypothetical protein F4604DRAFT_1802645 [Suillus subluteus]|nr:hypothetical protein F4604DRAFT_1802645 [Suillus subluteus]
MYSPWTPFTVSFVDSPVLLVAAKARWNSAAYDHFTTTLKRHLKGDGSADYLEFVFTCRAPIKECIERRGVSLSGPDATGAQQTITQSVSKYIPQAHRALIAMRFDAERAFSGGRLQVNHLQHGINSQTFKAQVAVGSWFNTPLMPDLGTATAIMHKKMGNDKGKGKDQADVVEID